MKEEMKEEMEMTKRKGGVLVMDSHSSRQGDNLVCEVKVRKVVDGETLMLPCGKTYKYLSTKGVVSTRGIMSHIMREHKFSEDGRDS